MEKYLIRSEGVLYTITDNILVPLSESMLESELFNLYGLENIPSYEIISNLMNPEILCWHESDEALPKLIAEINATPHPQEIISERIVFNSSIFGITNVEVVCTGDVHIAVSFDERYTWMYWDGTSWKEQTDDEWMDKQTIESITKEQWDELYIGAASFYIKVKIYNEESIDMIKFNFLNLAT